MKHKFNRDDFVLTPDGTGTVLGITPTKVRVGFRYGIQGWYNPSQLRKV